MLREQEAFTVTVNLPENTIIAADADAITTPEKQDADATAAEAAEKSAKAADTSVMVPKEGQIYISEIMFAGGGFLPQWIEISNGSRTEQVNLSGWTLRGRERDCRCRCFRQCEGEVQDS